MTILVTGGCGFIGSNFIRRQLAAYDEMVVNIDALTYAGNVENLEGAHGTKNYTFLNGDIGDESLVKSALSWFRPRAIINFAAESHVDNSIDNALPFVMTNVVGTLNLLECIRKSDQDIKFVHVSTDEVYGSLSPTDPAFTEQTRYDPRSPYSASKASSDHFVRAYHHTYGMKINITNCSNNYGPYQHPEKFIPTVVRKAIANQSIPIYGTGTNIRDWIHVDDHCAGIEAVVDRGENGHTYNIGGDCQVRNIELASKIIDILGVSRNLLSFVEDRKGHDFRYDIDSSKMKTLGWKPTVEFDRGLKETVRWYDNNMGWVKRCLAKH